LLPRLPLLLPFGTSPTQAMNKATPKAVAKSRQQRRIPPEIARDEPGLALVEKVLGRICSRRAITRSLL
jgi:hypothetical protein